jgi:hypothetical protein
MLAEHVLGRAHAHDRLMLAACRALRDEFVTPKAVDAAVATRQLRGPKPWLATARTCGTLQRRVAGGHYRRSSRAMKNPSVRSRSGLICRNLGSRGDASPGEPRPRSVASTRPAPRSSPMRSSPSRFEIVHIE